MKKLICMILALIMLMTCAGCAVYNKTIADVTYHYDYAWIELPGGMYIQGEVQSWTDFEDGDQIQVKIDGVTYLTDTTRCVLASGFNGAVG